MPVGCILQQCDPGVPCMIFFLQGLFPLCTHGTVFGVMSAYTSEESVWGLVRPDQKENLCGFN